MHPTQSQLFADHHNFQRLLNCFEVELSWYEKGQPDRVNLPVILDIFDYVQFYPETYHYPAEEAIYQLLAERNVENAELIAQLESEHKELDELTRRARQLFNAVANDSVVPVSKLIAIGREFLERHREHIDKENKFVYPLLSKHVSDDEWERITQEVEERDPFIIGVLEDEYESIFETILEADGEVLGSRARAINTPPKHRLPV